MNGRPDLSVQIGKLSLKNPVMPASGTFGYAVEMVPYIDVNRLGAIMVKCVTLKPRLGSLPHRLAESPSGSVCTIGLQNVGFERFVKEKMPFLRELEPPLFVNIGAQSVEEFGELTARLNKVEGIDALEINISCPNVKKGGMQFGVDPDSTYQVVKAIRQETDLTLVTKLTPNVTDVAVIAKAAVSAETDAISLINSPLAMVIDIEKRRSRLGRNLTGGISGPAIRPIAVRMVWQVAQAVSVPVIGAGGITCAEDALQFIIAGASAVQIGAYNLIDPTCLITTIDGIEAYLIRKKIGRLRDLIKSLEVS